MPNDILSNFFKGKTTYDETIKNIEDFMIEKIEEKVKDCKNWDKWKEKKDE